LAFDLTIVAWLLWRRSRPWAYTVLVVFHVMTAMLFQIGVFPWVMIALTPIFFEPDWPTRLRRRSALTGPNAPTASTGPDAAGPRDAAGLRSTSTGVGRPLIVFLIAFALMNVALPLRHWVAEGNVRWNDDGYEFVAMNGRLRQRMIDPTVDLASVSRWAPASAYVLALDPPVRS
jgi:vitamin K-dependent gamma-carboxylase